MKAYILKERPYHDGSAAGKCRSFIFSSQFEAERYLLTRLPLALPEDWLVFEYDLENPKVVDDGTSIVKRSAEL